MAVRDVVQAAAGVGGGDKLYVEDVFSTYLYTGNDSTQAIINGVDLAGEGGLVWIKNRTNVWDHALFDTERGISNYLKSNTTDGNLAATQFSSFDANGFTLNGGGTRWNSSLSTYASWTFRKAPKFFDVVTYTGNGVAGRTVAHNLGSVPGCIIIKAIDSAKNWEVYHRSVGNTAALFLNLTNAIDTTSAHWNNTSPTENEFTLGTASNLNGSGINYVAYLFAHDAGGFGDDGEQNVISCGSYTGNGSSALREINLGWEPQWVMVKNVTNLSSWSIADSMRGLPSPKVGVTVTELKANVPDAEIGGRDWGITANGIGIVDNHANINASGNTYIYIAIRRPMKTPESGTEVFATDIGNSSGAPEYYSGFPVDMSITGYRTGGTSWYPSLGSRLIQGYYLQTANTNIEDPSGQFQYDYMNGFYNGSQGSTLVSWMFRRAPSVFDVVAYKGNGVAGLTVAHNLGVAPELMIIKNRGDVGRDWRVYYGNNTRAMALNRTNPGNNYINISYWNNTSPTSSVFTVGTNDDVNSAATNGRHIAFLFATLPGVSKVGSYTGTGTTQTIDCGFSSGARFVLIKREDLAGDWYVWDSVRGIVAGNDPYLLLNSTAAEVTSTDYIDPVASGFEISSSAPAAINASGGSYIFLAIA